MPLTPGVERSISFPPEKPAATGSGAHATSHHHDGRKPRKGRARTLGGSAFLGIANRHADAESVGHVGFDQIHRTRLDARKPIHAEFGKFLLEILQGGAPGGRQINRSSILSRFHNCSAERPRCPFQPAAPAATPATPANGCPGGLLLDEVTARSISSFATTPQVCRISLRAAKLQAGKFLLHPQEQTRHVIPQNNR